MFNQENNEPKKLDWMYKGPNSLVEREEYLLGRSVDKTLEQLNEEEKHKQQGVIAPPKNRVEHECIPPSIRDFNKVVQAEQVDLSAKLQEDPLVAIKKREEETRRQFLQNPVQLKKLQKALKAQEEKKNKKKRKKCKHGDSDSDLNLKLSEKLLGKKIKKVSKEERDLDTILIHKYEEFKDKLTDSDIRDILNGKISDDSDSSSEDEKSERKSRKNKHETSSDSEEEERSRRNTKHKDRNNPDDNNKTRMITNNRYRDRHRNPNNYNSSSNNERHSFKHRASSDDDKKRNHHHSDSDDSDSSRKKKINYGLVSSDGSKIPFSSKKHESSRNVKSQPSKVPEPAPQFQQRRAHKLTEEEKEKLRLEMMENAVVRDKERSYNVKKYREKDEKERKEEKFDPEFIHKQLLKSAHTSSVESRIKANLNNIQRSSRDMDKHFSRRQ